MEEENGILHQEPDGQSIDQTMVSPEKVNAGQLVVYGTLQYVLIPIASGFLTTQILISGMLKKFNLERFCYISFPTIKIDTTTSSTYSGLMLAAGLGCVLGLILYQILKFAAKLAHLEIIKMAQADTSGIPSVLSFVKSLIKMICVPLIVILAALSARNLAQTGFIPGVNIDLQYQLFQVTSLGMIIVAALGCFLVFLYNAGLTILLKAIGRKKEQTKEISI